MEKKWLRLSKPWMNHAESEAVKKVLESGWLAEGEVTKQFEQVIAKYVGNRYAVAVTNCTVALELCLKSIYKHTFISDTLDTIIVPDFTHPATIQAVINAGVIPFLADVNLTSYNIEVNEKLEGHHLLPVSWGGNPLWFHWAGIIVPVEDAACSLGAKISTEYEWTKCFSFHPRKLITVGEGGMLTTNNEELAHNVNSLKHFGVNGGNYKFDDVRAAIGLAQMDKLENIIERRIKMAKIYDDLLRGNLLINPPQKDEKIRHTYQTYAVYLQKGNRDQIIQKLAEKGIETQVGAYALHLLPQYANVKRLGKLENSEKLHHNLLALPMAYNLTEEDQKFVVDELSKACHN